MKTINLEVKEMDNGFENCKLFIYADGLKEYIEAELSYFTTEELLQGYTTKFIGSLTHSEYNGINEFTTDYVANLDKYVIEDGKIYFDTCVEE